MFNLFSKSSFEHPIRNNELEKILDEVITDRISKYGFRKQNRFLWINTDTPLCRGISYMKLKGEAGTLTWGINLSFIPVVYRGKIVWYKTDKKFLMHLAENTDEYKSSFVGGDLKEGVASHWGAKTARKTITNLFNRYEGSIIKWFNNTATIENIISLTEKQIENYKYYSLNYPKPKYILCFLYAKAGMIEKALLLFDELDEYNFDKKEEIKKKVREHLSDLGNISK